MSENWSDYGLVTCGCCGAIIENTPEANQDYETRHCDIGYGVCKGCGGDPKAKSFWKKHGWAAESFYKARFKILEERLSPKAVARFRAMTISQKVRIVARLIEGGTMI